MLYILGVIIAVSMIGTFIVARQPFFPLPQAIKQPKNVDGNLVQLVEAYENGEDPEEFAASHGIYVEDGMVRVVIELKNEGDSPPSGYGIVAEARQGGLVQALIPVDKVYEIADLPQIKYIGLPGEPASSS